jgi:hypothetical protein
LACANTHKSFRLNPLRLRAAQPVGDRQHFIHRRQRRLLTQAAVCIGFFGHGTAVAKEGVSQPDPMTTMPSEFPQLAFNEWLERALEKLARRGLSLPKNR